MRIDANAAAQQAQEVAAAETPATRGGAVTVNGGEPANDTARLSAGQAGVEALAAQVNALPEIRQEKVAALGKAVREGSYQVSPEQTAEAVLSELLARSAAA